MGKEIDYYEYDDEDDSDDIDMTLKHEFINLKQAERQLMIRLATEKNPEHIKILNQWLDHVRDNLQNVIDEMKYFGIKVGAGKIDR